MMLEACTGRTSYDQLTKRIEDAEIKYKADDSAAKQKALEKIDQFIKILQDGVKDKNKVDAAIKATDGWIVHVPSQDKQNDEPNVEPDESPAPDNKDEGNPPGS